MSSEINHPDNVQTLYIFLENGWGNMILELLAGYSLSNFILPKKCKVVGLLTSAILHKHKTIYEAPHQKFGLPHPVDIGAIFPRLKFEDPERIKNLEPTDLHDSFPDWLLNRSEKEMIIRADWMNINAELIIPRLANLQTSLNDFRPAAIISEYLTRRYSHAFFNQGAVGMHLRVRQPGDIMSRVKFSTAEWYVNALKKFETPKLTDVYLISGISTGHSEAQQSLEEVCKAIISQFPDLKIHIIHDEPYYIDFFFLTHMANLIIANSTFSMTAAILGSRWGVVKRVLFPTQIVEISSEFSQLPGFEEVPGDEFVYSFRE